MSKQLKASEQDIDLDAEVRKGLESVFEIMQELWGELPETEPDLDPFVLLERLYKGFGEFYGSYAAKTPALRSGDLQGSIEDSLVYHEKSMQAAIAAKTGKDIWEYFEEVIELFQDTYDVSMAIIERGRIERGESRWYTAEEIKEEMRKAGDLD